MKQTTNYQFNLIESGDTFSPNPLNENMEKVEEALTDLDGELNNQISAVMAAMGSGGSTARITCGSYTGTGGSGSSNPTTLTFDFRPDLVIVRGAQFGHILIRGMDSSYEYYSNATINVTWGDKSVSFYSYSTNGAKNQLNESGTQYYYAAFSA